MIGNRVKNSPPPQPLYYERIRWVDAAKALGLFLVFWGHTLYVGSELAGIINRAIYSFHMPMYFILSGYVLKPESKPFNVFLRNIFKRILLPALILYLITLPLYFYSLDYSMLTAKSVIVQVFYIAGECAYNAPIWFFFCLFQVKIISKLLDLSNATDRKLIITAISFLLVSCVMYLSKWKYFNIFGVNKCILGLFFYSCGIMLQRTNYKRYIKQIGWMMLPLWILSGVILNSKCSMYGMALGNFGLFLLSSITGTLTFFMISKYCENSNKLRDYAGWTIFIVCSHFVFVSVIWKVAFLLSIEGTYTFDIMSFIYVLLVIYAYKYVCQLIERKVPILLGR